MKKVAPYGKKEAKSEGFRLGVVFIMILRKRREKEGKRGAVPTLFHSGIGDCLHETRNKVKSLIQFQTLKVRRSGIEGLGTS